MRSRIKGWEEWEECVQGLASIPRGAAWCAGQEGLLISGPILHQRLHSLVSRELQLEGSAGLPQDRAAKASREDTCAQAAVHHHYYKEQHLCNVVGISSCCCCGPRAELREASLVGVDRLATWAGVRCEFPVSSVWSVVSVGWLFFSSSFNGLGGRKFPEKMNISLILVLYGSLTLRWQYFSVQWASLHHPPSLLVSKKKSPAVEHFF